MISYEDARKFRENASAPLAWDEGVPPPPCDRIELTRRILEAAEAVGLEFPAWDKQFPFDAPKEKFTEFQGAICPTIPHQQYQGIPQTGVSGWADFGHYTGFRHLRLEEYIGRLEEDYFKPWETAWQFGVCADSKHNVLSFLKKAVSAIIEQLTQAYGDDYNYPNPEEICGSEIVAQRLPIIVGLDLSDHSRWYAGLDLSLVEERWLGLPELWAYVAPVVLGLVCIIGSIIGAVQGRYSGWLLLAIIPALIICAVVAAFKTTDGLKRQWINKTQTFDELAEKIVELKKCEWAELQRTYTAP